MPLRAARSWTGLPLLRSLPLLAGFAGLLASCNHAEPFPSGDPENNGPRLDPPAPITFSRLDDRAPAWSPDGSSLAYSYARDVGGRPGDRCVGSLPAAGGTRITSKCAVTTNEDSVRVLGPVAPGPDGRAAWIDARSLFGRQVPDKEALRLGILAGNDTGVAVRTFPYPVAALRSAIAKLAPRPWSLMIRDWIR